MPTKIKVVKLNTLFSVARGNKLDLNKMERCGPLDSGSTVFVGRSAERNGFAAFVSRIDDEEPYAPGLITVALGGSALASFVQPRPFYTAQNIDVLTPLTQMSLDVKLYYCLCIEANRFRYSTFGREANRTLRDLELPSLDSVPAWVEGASTQSVRDLCRDLVALAISPGARDR